MNPQQIKLPNFPKFCKDDRSVVKFYSPFHAFIITENSIEVEENEDYDNTLFTWRKFIEEEKYIECTPEDFHTMRDKTVEKLLAL